MNNGLAIYSLILLEKKYWKWTIGLLVLFSHSALAQDQKSPISLYDGYIVAGYVDQGVYLNYTGPNINLHQKDFRMVVGMLPSLRFRQDNSEPRNAFVTPSLGVGITTSYKGVALQIPLYYNAKSATQNGQWHIGIGLGYRLNELSDW
ncbi:MAG: hypothetical protein LAT68_16920 [Cyclobacteriaceae bacterium]|nr:hypothetical protein [Cyclobacteriaceae bacterium]MCH8517985.1 hypothetical protein [Cyclobacteriaceae bacterium]